MKKVRIAVVGAGIMGSHHILDIDALNNCELAAVCDVDPKVLAKYADRKDVALFENAQDMIDSGKVDVIIVSTPHYFHVPIALAAMEKGIHVLVEKPIAVQKSEAEKLVKAAETHPELKLAAMFCLRRMPVYRKLKSLIDSGELGTIRRINWIITDWFRTQHYYNSGTWRATWSGEGGGVLLNQCPHQLDLMQWFFGMPNRITARLYFGKYHDIEVEDEVSALWEYPDGKTAVFIASTGETPGTNRLEITAERGKVVLEKNTITFTRNEKTMEEYCRNLDLFDHPRELWNCAIPFKEGMPHIHREIISNFADAILNGTELEAPGIEGIRSLEIGNAMLLSQLKGGTVDLPLDSAEFDSQLNSLIEKAQK